MVGRHHQRPPGRTSQDPRNRLVRQLLRRLALWLGLGDRAAQPRDVRLERQRRLCRRLIVPELVDQPVQRHRTVDLQGQQSEHCPLLAAPQPQPNAVCLSGDRSEEPHPHLCSMHSRSVLGRVSEGRASRRLVCVKDRANPRLQDLFRARDRLILINDPRVRVRAGHPAPESITS